MSRETQPDSLREVINGIALLILCHMVAGVLIYALGMAVGMKADIYTVLAIWVYGAAGFFLWQLIYVLPLIFWLRRRGRTGMIKGLIIGAVLTALVNGVCYLSFFA